MRTFFYSEPIPRRVGVTDRLVTVGLFARFVDELLGGLPDVLMPTIRAAFGLSYVQVSLLWQILGYVAALFEPAIDLLLDVWSRRWIMACGALGLGLAVILIGAAPAFWMLMAGFALYGLASGPLAHTGDVVLVDAHPEAPERIFARSTLVDTVGALLAPILVALAFWANLNWRVLLIAGGAGSLVYAGIILRTRFVDFAAGKDENGGSLIVTLRQNLVVAMRTSATRRWLLFLLLLSVAESTNVFSVLWLREVIGMSQALIGVYRALELMVGVVTLLFLDRLLSRYSRRTLLLAATGSMLLLHPLWIFAPTLWMRFVIAAPLNFALTLFWPIGRAAALASVPGKAGTVAAITSLFGFLPLVLLLGIGADRWGLTVIILTVPMAAFAAIFWVLWRWAETAA